MGHSPACSAGTPNARWSEAEWSGGRLGWREWQVAVRDNERARQVDGSELRTSNTNLQATHTHDHQQAMDALAEAKHSLQVSPRAWPTCLHPCAARNPRGGACCFSAERLVDVLVRRRAPSMRTRSARRTGRARSVRSSTTLSPTPLPKTPRRTWRHRVRGMRWSTEDPQARWA